MEVMTMQVAQVGFWSAVLTTLLTLVTFGIALFTPPLSGPYCTGDCFSYPYTDTAARFPRDYLWMYPAIGLFLVYFILMTSIRELARNEHKVLSSLGLSFALMSTMLLVIDYFLQVSVVAPSLANSETEGVALFTQFNPHGIFITLEELGFLLMSGSFCCMAPAFEGKGKLGAAIRWIFIACFVFTSLAFMLYIVVYGIHREYRFEVAVITINWITLIVAGILLSLFYRRLPEGSAFPRG
jgi:hypothetical protein